VTAFSLDVVRDPSDEVAMAVPVTWAIGRLADAVEARGGTVRSIASGVDGPPNAIVTVAGAASRSGAELLASAAVGGLDGAEALVLAPDRSAAGVRLLACGSDPRGLTYAIVELADRIRHAEHPIDELSLDSPVVERPANQVRSVARLFCSEVEDMGWFRDEAFWSRYLSMLASERFNRVSLTLGLGYNYPRDVTDAYLYLAYPFLVDVPGFDVRVPQLPDEERDRNLAMLRLVSEQAVARGLDFQLGLWTHAYEWIDSPNAHHTIEGLTPETHAAYCRDAVAFLLDACPAIGGVTLRIHGESGVPEGTPAFWRTLFEGVAGCGRSVGLDLHAKGLDERTLADALDTGLHITVSPKFWAEHMGLPYHQAAIRELERLPRDDPSHLSDWHRSMKVSEGSRPFTRYGYADFLREDRPYDVVYRLWAGTQRLLLWGDPAFAAAYGRAASIAGSQGLEWCEPLTFKGREGSGLEGSRTGYADEDLVPLDDWEKYAYTYRLFGRLTYNPDASPEVWRRMLRSRFGAGALDAERALASASRILPLVTVAHHPSASNNYYWPEIYTDMPIVGSEDGTQDHPYLDTPEPRRFGTVMPLDPEAFSSVVEYVSELNGGQSSGRISPVDVAFQLERLADEADRRRERFEEATVDRDPNVRRWSIDIAILAALGRFFAGKLRAAVAYERHVASGTSEPLALALTSYRSARRAWQLAASLAEGVYVADLTFGPQPRIRGHWVDRLDAIDADLRDMGARADRLGAEVGEPVPDASRRELGVDQPSVEFEHVSPTVFQPGEEVRLVMHTRGEAGATVERVVVRYRPMNQALAFAEIEAEREADGFTATIPGVELDGRYPLAYAFVMGFREGTASRYPGLGPDLADQPYLVLRPRSDDGLDRRAGRRSGWQAVGFTGEPDNVTIPGSVAAAADPRG
jgi:hypothetical protein